MSVFAALLIAALMGGGTSFAAENALPGDTLYPVKVHVNESVREALALSHEGKAHVEGDLAARRLDEIQQLLASGKLSSTTAAVLTTALEKHIAKADAESDSVAKDDPAASAELNASLKARLAAHKDIVDVFLSASSTLPHSMNGILASLTAKLSATTTAKVNAEMLAHLSSERLASLGAHAKRESEQAKETVASLNARLAASTTATTSVNALLAARATAMAELAASRYAAGAAALAASSTDKATAYLAFVQSLNASFQTEAYAKAALHLGMFRDHKDKPDEKKMDKPHDKSATSSDDRDDDKDKSGRDQHDDIRVNATTNLNVRMGDGDEDDKDGVHLEGGIRGGLGI
ncbi:MAG TPA: DUF5667 domain-containing protein [Candidatus Paceibacterota bacterium]|nr:DUF5667 domain-containing protein [Candidatus Paceibacterota bacterium]